MGVIYQLLKESIYQYLFKLVITYLAAKRLHLLIELFNYLLCITGFSGVFEIFVFKFIKSIWFTDLSRLLHLILLIKLKVACGLICRKFNIWKHLLRALMSGCSMLGVLSPWCIVMSWISVFDIGGIVLILKKAVQI